MVSQFAKKLDAQQTVKRHEEEEEQCDVINLLTWTPVNSKNWEGEKNKLTRGGAVVVVIVYLKIWLIRDLGMENFRKTRMKRIIINGRGARRIDR